MGATFIAAQAIEKVGADVYAVVGAFIAAQAIEKKHLGDDGFAREFIAAQAIEKLPAVLSVGLGAFIAAQAIEKSKRNSPRSRASVHRRAGD